MRYDIETQKVRAKHGCRIDFGGVEIKKAYVLAHLIPLNVHPRLLKDICDTYLPPMTFSAMNCRRSDHFQYLAGLRSVVVASAAAIIHPTYQRESDRKWQVSTIGFWPHFWPSSSR
ncbi:MAG: hypothetical protein WBH04_11430 [Albidovulum sp.]